MAKEAWYMAKEPYSHIHTVGMRNMPAALERHINRPLLPYKQASFAI